MLTLDKVKRTLLVSALSLLAERTPAGAEPAPDLVFLDSAARSVDRYSTSGERTDRIYRVRRGDVKIAAALCRSPSWLAVITEEVRGPTIRPSDRRVGGRDRISRVIVVELPGARTRQIAQLLSRATEQPGAQSASRISFDTIQTSPQRLFYDTLGNEFCENFAYTPATQKRERISDCHHSPRRSAQSPGRTHTASWAPPGVDNDALLLLDDLDVGKDLTAGRLQRLRGAWGNFVTLTTPKGAGPLIGAKSGEALERAYRRECRPPNSCQFIGAYHADFLDERRLLLETSEQGMSVFDFGSGKMETIFASGASPWVGLPHERHYLPAERAVLRYGSSPIRAMWVRALARQSTRLDLRAVAALAREHTGQARLQVEGHSGSSLLWSLEWTVRSEDRDRVVETRFFLSDLRFREPRLVLKGTRFSFAGFLPPRSSSAARPPSR